MQNHIMLQTREVGIVFNFRLQRQGESLILATLFTVRIYIAKKNSID